MNGLSFDTHAVAPDTHAVSSNYPIPGFGLVPINAFVLHAEQPVLIDTGYAAAREDFMQALERVIEPADLRWIWLTHVDPDHVGNLETVLQAAPQARLVSTFLGLGKLGLLGVVPERVYLLNPGQGLDVGDRVLQALRPPTFDAPETTALFDPRTETLFSADSFGALLQEPAQEAAAIGAAQLKAGMLTWASLDAPWLEFIDQHGLAKPLQRLRDLQPRTLLSSHLPPASGILDALIENLMAAAGAAPFQGPDQAALERMLAASEPTPPQDASAPRGQERPH